MQVIQGQRYLAHIKRRKPLHISD